MQIKCECLHIQCIIALFHCYSECCLLAFITLYINLLQLGSEKSSFLFKNGFFYVLNTVLKAITEIQFKSAPTSMLANLTPVEQQKVFMKCRILLINTWIVITERYII